MKKFLRSIRLQIGKFLLDRKHPTHVNSTENVKKIIFLRHDGKIGDYIVSSFVFRELKKHNPHLYISVVCSTKTHYLFKENKFIDKLYIVKTKNIVDYIKTAVEIRQAQFDVLIDPTTLIRNRDLLLIKLINAKINIGYQKGNYQLFDLNIQDNTLHFSQIYQNALTMIGYENVDTQYDIPFDKTSTNEVRNFLSQNHLYQFIAINFFGASSSRNFSDEKIYAFLSYLHQESTLPLVLLTFPEVNEKLKKLSHQFSNIFIFEQTKTIFHTIELIHQSQLVISPDTSIIHIASGLNKPIITFYSSDENNFTHWHPNSTAPVHILRYKKSVNEINPEQLKPKWLENK